MKISCVIPTKDRCNLVQRAIMSVLNQEMPCHEVVVVDDGSVDGTREALAAVFPTIRLVHCSGVGPGMARNAGVAATTGDIIMFLDSDDVWLPHHVRILSGAMKDCDDSVAYGITKTVDQVQGGEFSVPAKGEEARGSCFEALLRWCFLVPSAMAVRRHAFDAVGGFPLGPLGEDWHFFLRLAQEFSFAFVGPAPITIRYLHEGSQCCLGSRDTILALLRRIRNHAWPPPYNLAVRERFSFLEQWVMGKEKSWATVQEWYNSMKEERIV